MSLPRARRMGLAVVLALIAALAGLGILAQFLRPHLPDELSFLSLLLGYPLTPRPENSVPRLIWLAVAAAALPLVCYWLLVGLRRVLPPRGALFAAFMLGWACTAMGMLVSGPLALWGVGGYWPGYIGQPLPVSLTGPGSGMWLLAFGWIGGAAAAVTYARTARAVPPAAEVPTNSRPYATAGVAALVLTLLLLATGAMARNRAIAKDVLNPLFALRFPEPLSSSWLPDDDPTRHVLLDVVALMALIVFAAVALMLLLGTTLRRVRPRGSGSAVFVLGWGCAVLVTGATGLLREGAFFLADRFTSGTTSVWSAFGMADGVNAGLLTGWLVGLVTLTAHLWLRPAEGSTPETDTPLDFAHDPNLGRPSHPR
ncbi:hypothetical protein ACIBG7_23995 [Nonomuraea sp. NPDC050328]|uniref:hypothetical protein n=1 Tax=Nonomuraea sp. NPDC050328 TaxID=3364361 RepID=UPI00379AFF4F